jgi:hypothetical protein
MAGCMMRSFKSGPFPTEEVRERHAQFGCPWASIRGSKGGSLIRWGRERWGRGRLWLGRRWKARLGGGLNWGLAGRRQAEEGLLEALEIGVPKMAGLRRKVTGHAGKWLESRWGEVARHAGGWHWEYRHAIRRQTDLLDRVNFSVHKRSVKY